METTINNVQLWLPEDEDVFISTQTDMDILQWSSLSIQKTKTLEDENLTWLLISMVCRLFILWDFYMSIIETEQKGDQKYYIALIIWSVPQID